MPTQRPIKLLRTATLEIAYEEYGPPAGAPVVLLHGFPDDPRVYDGVVAALAGSRFRLDRAVPARLRADALSRPGHAALRAAGRAGQGPPRPASTGCTYPPRSCAATTGAGARRASWRRCGPSGRAASSRCAATTSRTSRSRAQAGGPGPGASPLVPVVFPDRARPGRARREPARHLAPAVGAVVAEPRASTTRSSGKPRRRSPTPISWTS